MKTADSNLWVCVASEGVWIKVEGQANFNCSVDFKTLVMKLWDKGYHSFHLDLSRCKLMDSTFLGVLANLGIKLVPPEPETKCHPIHLINPSPRIADLLENLGVTHLFTVRKEEAPHPDGPYEHQIPCSHTRKEMAQTSLEAHETLMSVNPNNVSKFKEVTKFLAEDLQKME